MNSGWSSYTNPKRQHGPVPRRPFICLFTPFVCRYGTPVRPIVCRNVPSVGFSPLITGFTLIELMITLVVLAILLGVAVPAMTNFIRDQRLAGQANDFVGDLSYARAEAIRRGTTVTLCKTANPNAVPPACNTTVAAAWTTGRIVFADADADGTVDAGDTILRVTQALEGGSNGLYVDDGNATMANRVTFRPTGLTTFSGTTDLQLFLCDKRGPTQGRALIVSPTGRARVGDRGKKANGSGLVSTDCT